MCPFRFSGLRRLVDGGRDVLPLALTQGDYKRNQIRDQFSIKVLLSSGDRSSKPYSSSFYWYRIWAQHCPGQ